VDGCSVWCRCRGYFIGTVVMHASWHMTRTNQRMTNKKEGSAPYGSLVYLV
jgi:hypothetical protein